MWAEFASPPRTPCAAPYATETRKALRCLLAIMQGLRRPWAQQMEPRAGDWSPLFLVALFWKPPSCVILSTSLSPSLPPGICSQVWTLFTQSYVGCLTWVFIGRFLDASQGHRRHVREKLLSIWIWEKSPGWNACFSCVYHDERGVQPAPACFLKYSALPPVKKQQKWETLYKGKYGHRCTVVC